MDANTKDVANQEKQQQPDFQILPTLGIKCYLYDDGSVLLEQYDPYSDEQPNMVDINANQIDTVIQWLNLAKQGK